MGSTEQNLFTSTWRRFGIVSQTSFFFFFFYFFVQMDCVLANWSHAGTESFFDLLFLFCKVFYIILLFILTFIHVSDIRYELQGRYLALSDSEGILSPSGMPYICFKTRVVSYNSVKYPVASIRRCSCVFWFCAWVLLCRLYISSFQLIILAIHETSRQIYSS
jgi:hypothetical protein